MHFECRSLFYPKPSDPSDFIRPFEISVHCFASAGHRVTAARLAVDYLDIALAESKGVSICHVCDADSAGWLSVYEDTIEPSPNFTRIREDFHFDDSIYGLVFVHQAVFHPALRDWQRMILDAVCKMFPELTATVMWKDIPDLVPKELASLGFGNIAGSDLLFRPNMIKPEYSADEDERDPLVDLEVPSDAAKFVNERWDDTERPDFAEFGED